MNNISRDDLNGMRGPFHMRTVSGVDIDIRRPSPDQINLDDIATGLSNLCRYAGQVRRFYSVAQHSIICAEVMLAELERDGRPLAERRSWTQGAFLHDAAEAYLVDLTSQTKRALREAGSTAFDALELGFWHAIQKRFDLSLGADWHLRMKRIDRAVAAREQMVLRAPYWNGEYVPSVEPADVEIRALSFSDARDAFNQYAWTIGLVPRG
mgnify:CR=1 FL=1